MMRQKQTLSYPVRNCCNHPPLQLTQVDRQTLAELFEERQVQRDPTQRIKHAKHLTRHGAGGEVAVTCGRLQTSGQHANQYNRADVKDEQLTNGCDDRPCEEEGAAKVPVTGVRRVP